MDLIIKSFKTLTSTNDWSKENFASFDRQGLTVVLADMQTAGRGRYGRQWLSLPGGLYASFCFTLENGRDDPLHYTQVMALSLVKLLKEKGLHPKIKWPNDILISGKKIAGILCETLSLKENLGIVLGVGLNVNIGQKDLESAGQPATSLLVETEASSAVNELVRDLSLLFNENLSVLRERGFDAFREIFFQYYPLFHDLEK